MSKSNVTFLYDVPTSVVSSPIRIDACEFSKDLEMTVKGKTVVLSADKQPRQGWQEAIQEEINSKPLRYLGEWEW